MDTNQVPMFLKVTTVYSENQINPTKKDGQSVRVSNLDQLVCFSPKDGGSTFLQNVGIYLTYKSIQRY
jgi:hypothetical protein